MKKTTKLLSPEAFEAVCNSWEQRMKEFILQLSDGSIPTLRDVEWTIKKGVFSSVSQMRMERKNAGRAGRILDPIHL